MSEQASRRLAVAAFLVAATAPWMSWWRVSLFQDGELVGRSDASLFIGGETATSVPPIASGVLLLAALLFLFVRIAGRSWQHEPPAWTRDLYVAAALLAVSAVVAVAWPETTASFWGGRTLTDSQTGTTYREAAAPMLGWWLAIVGAALAAVAARVMPRQTA